MSTFHAANTGESSASSASSRKFALDETSTRPIIVYKLRGGYEISSEASLCKELDNSTSPLRCSTKPIPRGSSRVDVQNRDLFNEPERTTYSKYPNARSSLASVGLPKSVYWRRLLLGAFPKLYIVSPDNSPTGSEGASPVEREE